MLEAGGQRGGLQHVYVCFLSDPHNQVQTLKWIWPLCSVTWLMFFLNTFFGDSFPQEQHPILLIPGGSGAQPPGSWGSGVKGEAWGALLGGRRGSPTGCPEEESGRINKHL